MDPRLFVLICLAAASRHQPSSALEVEANDPQGHAFNETDFQRLRDAVNSGDEKRMSDIAYAEMWPNFVKAHPEEGWGLFQKLAKDEHEWVRCGAASSPAWPRLLETHNAEAGLLFEELATDDHWRVKWGATYSPAWPMLLETHNAEAWSLFEKLAKDKHLRVSSRARYSPLWPDLIQSSLSQSWQLFAELMSDQSWVGVVDLPLWKAFGKVPPTAVTEHGDSQELLGIARSLQKVADHGLSLEIKGLPLINGFSTPLRRSTNETWLGEMVKLPLFVSKATLRVSPAENIYLDCLSEFFSKRIL